MRSFLLSLCVLTCSILKAQELELNSATEFKDGIYLSYNDFKTNTPSVSLNDIHYEIVEQKNKTSQSVTTKRFSSSITIAITIDSLWGICIEGRPYIATGGTNKGDFVFQDDGLSEIKKKNQKVYSFSKFVFTGHLCYFFTTNYKSSGISFTTLLYPDKTAKMKSDQYLLKVSTGELTSFNSSNLLKLISNDIDLYLKYKKMSKNQKKKEIFNVFREYNSRNPIFL